MEYERGQSLKRWWPQHAPLPRARRCVALLGAAARRPGGRAQVGLPAPRHQARQHLRARRRHAGAARLRRRAPDSADRDLTDVVTPGYAPFRAIPHAGQPGSVDRHLRPGRRAVLDDHGQEAGRSRRAGQERHHAARFQPGRGQRLRRRRCLHAIEWAMHPDESQTAANRGACSASAIQGSERPDALAGRMPRLQPRPTRHGRGGPGAVRAGARRSAQPVAARSGATCWAPSCSWTWWATRAHSVDNQVTLKKLFNELIAKALKGVARGHAASPSTPATARPSASWATRKRRCTRAMLLRDLLGQRYGTLLSARIGLHMGPGARRVRTSTTA